MFATLKTTCTILDNNIKYYKDAKAAGLGDAEYFESMERRIRSGLERIRRNSTNDRLISKYDKKVNDLFKEV